MRVVLLQRDIVWGDPAENLKRLEPVLDRNAGADLFVLPEMFTTGFATQAGAVVERDPSASLAWMRQKAEALDAALAGSIALETEGRLVNRFYFVTPSGEVTYYDKHHLFTYGGEGERYTAGAERVSLSWRGVRWRLAVCYDLRFPLWLRNTDGYDALLCVASWPTPRRAQWDALLRARAIENQCYVLGVNRVGADPACQYNGGTVLLDPQGRVIDACADGFEDEARGVLDLDALAAYRRSFPVLADADPFRLG